MPDCQDDERHQPINAWGTSGSNTSSPVPPKHRGSPQRAPRRARSLGRLSGVACGAAWSRLQKKRKKPHILGFSWSLLSKFHFFFLFPLYLRSRSYFDSWVQSPFSWDECSCAPQNRFWCWWKRVLQVTNTILGFSWTLLLKK